MRILFAEDDPNISTITKIALIQMGGHEVDHVGDGQSALDKALDDNYDYDLILLDEMMPKINGLLVCQEYKKSCIKSVPVIFLSAKSQHSDVELFNKHGLGHILKPFDPMTLCQQIEELLRQTEVA